MFKRSVTAVLLALGLAGLAVACAPPTPPKPGRYVSMLGSDTGTCSTPNKACATINYAISQATTGQTIFVSAGTYPEKVVVDKSLKFSGPNAGRPIGTNPVVRKAEAVVKEFRSPGVPHPTSAYQFDVTIDGFTVDPQGDASILTPDTHNVISLFGGNNVKVVNNVLHGGDYNPNCSYTCTDMADSAVWISSGTYEVANNLVENFRRPLDIVQASAATPIVSASYHHNVVQNFTWRAFWALEMGSAFPDNSVSITKNVINGTTGALTTNAPTGALVTAGGVTMSDNTFKNLDTGVFEQFCTATNPSDFPTKYLNNTFDEVSLGLQLYIGASDCTGRNPSVEMTGNSFTGGLWDPTGTQTTGVAWFTNGTPPALDATCNFWGDANGPGVGTNAIAGAGITTSPWQTTQGGAC